MEELLQRVLDELGKTQDEFDREVEKLRGETDQAKKLETLKQQQEETSTLLLEFMEHIAGGM
ncbi:hypothetical protein [Peribacillus loiseleuriae]|uniref:Uncharacterized protein n=1 Tax=Peribacillus loiseleuriae TaxID=1679170 RepID=A0A0K9GRI7_9BACI|nr:hypothetical protein [Peribacillus loiseleuriae]KMY49248.1 hypothetical protein AC625_06700 [Peribacillus loiseleuriae]